MCGIAGIVGNNISNNFPVIKAMTDAIAHRGPDGEGSYKYDNCVLGHRRLSIIDLSTGDQPMLSASKKQAIVFNGEIYGFQKVKANLKDYNFKTTSDTEVILALYERFGTSLCEHLPGMFAFALWDEEKQRLVCGRDRFGEKPFYYAIGRNGEFIFSSEIKAIIASGLVKVTINKNSLAHYLKHLYVHPGASIYNEIFTLPPAHSLVFENGKVQIKRYWHIPQTKQNISLSEATETFRFLFEQSVQQQLIADVPVGAFLSGGIDSSLVVAVASKFKQNIKTIAFGFGNEINELPFAKQVADKYRTDHVEIQQSLPDLGDLLLSMQEIYDEPFADSSCIPTYLISQAASKHLKVVLTGDAGDELLGGYAFWYRNLQNIEKAKQVEGLSKWLLPYAAKVSRKLGNNYFTVLQQQQTLRKRGNDVAAIHSSQNLYFSNEQLRLFGLDFKNGTKPFSFHFENNVNDAMKMDIEDYMPGDILVKTDRAAMATGLELRAPFLDKALAEFCISLPYSLKLNYNEEKLLAKSAYGQLLPDTILKRSKQGFGAPVTSWLKSGALKELKGDYLQNPNSRLYSIIDYKEVQPFIGADNYLTWVLLVLSLWLEKHRYH
jgi:asparagine synthase (glutamine-hydrolysing)